MHLHSARGRNMCHQLITKTNNTHTIDPYRSRPFAIDNIVSDHEWNMAIEGHSLIQFILEHIKVVQAVGLVVVWLDVSRPQCRGWQGQRRSVLWNTIYMT